MQIDCCLCLSALMFHTGEIVIWDMCCLIPCLKCDNYMKYILSFWWGKKEVVSLIHPAIIRVTYKEKSNRFFEGLFPFSLQLGPLVLGSFVFYWGSPSLWSGFLIFYIFSLWDSSKLRHFSLSLPKRIWSTYVLPLFLYASVTSLSPYLMLLVIYPGFSHISKKLKDLVAVLVNCFKEFIPLVHAMPVMDALSFDCMYSILQSIDLAVRFLVYGNHKNKLEAKLHPEIPDVTAWDQTISSVLVKKLLGVFPLYSVHHFSEKVLPM